MRAIFVRHGQSTGNAGMPCHDLATIELTEKGWDQARRIADDWTEAPSLIVTSPFLRTQQTAAPTIERFHDVPVEMWPIEEFTYLQPSRWNGTLAADRAPHLERYWGEADPAYCDGEGAESFGTLLRRAEAALARLAALPLPGPVYVFSHGQFIQAVRAIVTESELDDRGKMLGFWRKGEPPAIRNAEMIVFELTDQRWHSRSGNHVDPDRIINGIDRHLPYLHKERWAQEHAQLRDDVRNSTGEAQDRAEQAVRDHYATRNHPEASRAALIDQSEAFD